MMRRNRPVIRIRRGLSGLFYIPQDPGFPTPGDIVGDPPVAEVSSSPIPVPALPVGATQPGPLRRRMTYEEAMAQVMLQNNQTVAGTNNMADPNSAAALPVNSSGQVMTAKAPSLDMPPSGQSYRATAIEGQAPAPVVLPNINAQAVVVAFRVPIRQNGTIEFLANQYIGPGFQEGSGLLIWQLLADGVPIKGYENITVTLGTPAAPGPLGRSPIRIFDSQLIQLVCTNTGIPVANQVLIGLLGGHFYPIEEETNSPWQ